MKTAELSAASVPLPLKGTQPRSVSPELYAHSVAVNGPFSSAMIWNPRPRCGLLNVTVSGPFGAHQPVNPSYVPPIQRILASGAKFPYQPQSPPEEQLVRI